MARKFFRVGRSKTGLGLFATDIIPKGTIIAEYRGRRLRNEQADKLADRGNKYLYEINNRWTIDGSNRRNLARYANHACRPNSESDVTRQRKVIIRAIKKIRPGDEITYDYGEDYFDLIIKPLGCNCDKCQEKRSEQRRLARKKRLAKLARAKAAEAKKAQAKAARTRAARTTAAQSAKVQASKAEKESAKRALSKTVSKQAVATPETLEQRKAA
jgi:SET domain-containing protein